MDTKTMDTNGHANGHSPLDGIRILDCSIFQNGPFSTVLLSDMGAEVIKIEDPVKGDPGRSVRLTGKAAKLGVNTYFETMNRNKKAITLNLKHPKGREAFYKMVKKADVVVQNFTLGVAEKLGIDYESLRKVNPRIIRAANTGFGHRGPDADMRVLDGIGQARSGFTYLMSDPDGTPANTGPLGLADQTGAIMLAYAISMALLARERFGVGQNVETSQLGSMMTLQALGIHKWTVSEEQGRRTQRTVATNPVSNTYRGSDGKWLCIMAPQADLYWPTVAKVAGRDDLLEDPRFSSIEARMKHSRELIALLDEAFAKRPIKEWIAELRKQKVPVGPVQNYADLTADPQCIANEYLVKVPHPAAGELLQVGVTPYLSKTPGRARHSAPEYGQHTEEVLLEHGYTWQDIEKMRTEGAI